MRQVSIAAARLAIERAAQADTAEDLTAALVELDGIERDAVWGAWLSEVAHALMVAVGVATMLGAADESSPVQEFGAVVRRELAGVAASVCAAIAAHDRIEGESS